VNPTRPFSPFCFAALVALGRHDEVEKCIADAARHPGGPTLAATLMLESSVEMRGHGLPAGGRRMAERALASLRSIPESKLDAAGRRRLVLALLCAERWQEAAPLHAALAAAWGEKDEAIELLERAIAEGYSEGYSPSSYSFHRSVELAPLLGYPPFEELMKPKG
jgi:hypothetical protein